MTHAELDRMLSGAEGLTMYLTDGEVIVLAWAELLSPEAFRASVRRQTGYVVPEHTEAEHRAVVGALCALSTTEVPMAA